MIPEGNPTPCVNNSIHPAAVRCDMVLHRALRARRVRKNGIGGEVQHGVASDVLCEYIYVYIYIYIHIHIHTYLNIYVTPHLHRE